MPEPEGKSGLAGLAQSAARFVPDRPGSPDKADIENFLFPNEFGREARGRRTLKR